ncbi:MAG: hypothetical protein Q7R34_07200 [Dehalococcoidia bacterium]|nr:hypothetical protein [Dehalococcoidia bacterium]
MVWEQVFINLVHKDVYFALALLIGFVLVGWLLYFLLKTVVRRLIEKSGTNLDNLVLESLEKPVFISLGLFGLYLALWFLPIIETVDVLIKRVFSAAFIVLGWLASLLSTQNGCQKAH